MVPSAFVQLAAWPLSANGKIDRKQLPAPQFAVSSSPTPGDVVITAALKTVVSVVARVLKIPEAHVNPRKSIFQHPGGASLTAVMVVNLLRSEGISVPSVGWLLESGDLQEFATKLEAQSTSEVMTPSELPVGTLRGTVLPMWLAAFLQILGVIVNMTLTLALPLALMAYIRTSAQGLPIWAAIPINIAGTLLGVGAMFGVTVSLKWLLVGRLRPGSHPVYSCFFVRWWLMTVVSLSLPVAVLNSFTRFTPLAAWFYRAMGAHIGRDVLLGQGLNGIPNVYDYDLVTIGDRSCVEMATYVMGSDVRGGMLHLGHTVIGSDSYIGMGTVVMPGTFLGDYARVGPYSLLNGLKAEEPYQVLLGCPAVSVGSSLRSSGMKRPVWPSLILVGFVAFAAIIEATIAGTGALNTAIKASCGSIASTIILLMLGYIPLGIFSMIVLIVTKWLLLGRLAAGERAVSPWFNFAVWFIDTLYNSTLCMMGQALLDPAISYPWFLRLLGVKIGKRSQLTPGVVRSAGFDLVEIGDNIITGSLLQVDPMAYNGDTATIGRVKIGHRCTFGNTAYLGGDVELADKVTIGTACVISSGTKILEHSTTWTGNPAMNFGLHRDDDELQTDLLQQEAWGDVQADHQKQYFCLGQFLSFMGPGIQSFLFGLMLVMAYFGSHYSLNAYKGGILVSLVIVVANIVLTMLITMAMTAFLKRCIFRKFKGKVALWSLKHISWLIYMNFNTVLSLMVLEYIQGTPVMNSWLRLLGAKIGARVYFDTMPPVETDCLEFGDDVVVLPGIQTLVPHSFDRGQLQFAPLKVGNLGSLGINACMMLSTEVGEATAVGPLSLIGKNERLEAGKYMHGNPLEITAPYLPVDYAVGVMPDSSNPEAFAERRNCIPRRRVDEERAPLVAASSRSSYASATRSFNEASL